jgi:hypothetical protein
LAGATSKTEIRKTASEFAAREIAPYVAEHDLGRAPTLKKMIFCAATEEIIVGTDVKKQTLQFAAEALEIIRWMAVRQGDDQIASVLNRLGHCAERGNGGIRTVWL